MASFRYLVEDVDASVKFYTGALGFSLVQQYGPAMAILSHGDFSIWLAGPVSSAAQPMPDGAQPKPGGWNRVVVEVQNISDLVAKMRGEGVVFRNEIIRGPGGQQTLCEDPSGNVVELFQPA